MNIVILGWSTLTNGDISPERFKNLGNLKVYDVLPEDEVCRVAADANAILLNRVVITKKIIDAVPDLKYIGSFATGYNNIDVAYAKQKGIKVTNVPGYSTNAVATHTFAFLLALCLNIVKYNDHVKNGGWSYAPGANCFPFKTEELEGKTLGIFGFGNIGKRVAQIAKAFNMNVVFYSKSRHNSNIATQVDFDTLLKMSDFLSLHAPLSDETYKIIDENALSKMKETAYLINTSRGGLVDENALANALNCGKISGAAIDVAANEPLDNTSPLFTAANCIYTPHVAWGPLETRQRLIDLGYENLEKFIMGNPINLVEV